MADATEPQDVTPEPEPQDVPDEPDVEPQTGQEPAAEPEPEEVDESPAPEPIPLPVGGGEAVARPLTPAGCLVGLVPLLVALVVLVGRAWL